MSASRWYPEEFFISSVPVVGIIAMMGGTLPVVTVIFPFNGNFGRVGSSVFLDQGASVGGFSTSFVDCDGRNIGVL